MAATAQSAQASNTKTRLISQAMILTALVAGTYIIAGRVLDAGKKLMAPPAPIASDAVNAHCAEFISLAKAKYQDDWKFRLDPRDTICAAQIQDAWELQSAEPRVADPAPARPTYVGSDEPESMPEELPADADASRARNPETYCLNVISLARSKYGADWKSRVTTEEASGCEQAIAAAP